jgi:hypothetical protein
MSEWRVEGQKVCGHYRVLNESGVVVATVWKYGLGKRHVSGEYDALKAWQDLPESAAYVFYEQWEQRYHNWSQNPWAWAVTFKVVK